MSLLGGFDLVLEITANALEQAIRRLVQTVIAAIPDDLSVPQQFDLLTREPPFDLPFAVPLGETTAQVHLTIRSVTFNLHTQNRLFIAAAYDQGSILANGLSATLLSGSIHLMIPFQINGNSQQVIQLAPADGQIFFHASGPRLAEALAASELQMTAADVTRAVGETLSEPLDEVPAIPVMRFAVNPNRDGSLLNGLRLTHLALDTRIFTEAGYSALLILGNLGETRGNAADKSIMAVTRERSVAVLLSQNAFRHFILKPTLFRSLLGVSLENAQPEDHARLPPVFGSGAFKKGALSIQRLEDHFSHDFIRLDGKARYKFDCGRAKVEFQTNIGLVVTDGNLDVTFTRPGLTYEIDLKWYCEVMRLLPGMDLLIYATTRSIVRRTRSNLKRALEAMILNGLFDELLSLGIMQLNLVDALIWNNSITLFADLEDGSRTVPGLREDIRLLQSRIEHNRPGRSQTGELDFTGVLGDVQGGVLGELLHACAGVYPYEYHEVTTTIHVDVVTQLWAFPLEIRWLLQTRDGELHELEPGNHIVFQASLGYPGSDNIDTTQLGEATLYTGSRGNRLTIQNATHANFSVDLIAEVRDPVGRRARLRTRLRFVGARVDNPQLQRALAEATEVFRDRVRRNLGKLVPGFRNALPSPEEPPEKILPLVDKLVRAAMTLEPAQWESMIMGLYYLYGSALSQAQGTRADQLTQRLPLNTK